MYVGPLALRRRVTHVARHSQRETCTVLVHTFSYPRPWMEKWGLEKSQPKGALLFRFARWSALNEMPPQSSR